VTAVDLAALDAARAAATPGPWAMDDVYDTVVTAPDGPGHRIVAETFAAEGRNTALIVAAVNALPDLIAAARRLRALRDALEALAVKYDTPIADGPCAGQRALYGGGDLCYRLRSVLQATAGGEGQ
jgi:hypothetical protein